MMKHENFNIDTDYPLRHLPDEIREPIVAVHDLGAVAVEIVGQVVLATISMATQHISDVKVPRLGQKPLNSYFLSLADSGAGKTTAESFAMVTVNAHIDALEADYGEQWQNYKIDLKAYQSEMKAVERDMRGHARQHIAEALRDVGAAPLPPLRPDAIARMPTYKGLLNLLRDGQPSVALINDDSSGFIKGALNDAEMVTLLTDIWSATPYRRITDRERLLLKGRRLSAHLMVQPNHADALLHGAHTAEQGIIPRFNIAIAPLRQKTAPKGDIVAQERIVGEFNNRVAALIAHPGAVKNRNEVVVDQPLVMTSEAEELFVRFLEEMAASSQPGAPLAAIRSSAIRRRKMPLGWQVQSRCSAEVPRRRPWNCPTSPQLSR